MPIRVVAIFFNIVVGLWLESWGAAHGFPWMEHVVGVITLAHLGFYVVSPPVIGSLRITRRMLLSCLVLATLGELFLSAVWGLYLYRVSVLPLFVPPGHVLLFLAGLQLVHGLSSLHWAKALVTAVPFVAALAIGFQIHRGYDVLSAGLFGIFLLCLIKGKERPLYSVMFVLALALEIQGTWMGAWTWAPVAPVLEVSSHNPPLAAGVFYAVLDFMVMGLVPAAEAGQTLIHQSTNRHSAGH
jgi:hypothetical protein